MPNEKRSGGMCFLSHLFSTVVKKLVCHFCFQVGGNGLKQFSIFNSSKKTFVSFFSPSWGQRP